MPDLTSQDSNIAYLPTLIDLFMIGRCDTDTYEWSAHVITVFESDSPPDFVFA